MICRYTGTYFNELPDFIKEKDICWYHSLLHDRYTKSKDLDIDFFKREGKRGHLCKSIHKFLESKYKIKVKISPEGL